MLRNLLALMAFAGSFCSPARADVLIVQSVHIDINGRTKSIERKVFLKDNRMRIESRSADQSTATVIDLDHRTIAQIDLAKGAGTVYEIGKLHDYVAKSASGQNSTNIGPENQVSTVVTIKCGQHTFDLSLPAFRDTGARVIAHGSVCLAKEGSANQEYSAFLTKALGEGVVVNYISDNAVLLALAREQTELYRLLSTRGGIPLSLDLTTHFEGGLIGKLWNMAASHSTVTTTNISTLPLALSAIDVPSSISPTHREH